MSKVSERVSTPSAKAKNSRQSTASRIIGAAVECFSEASLNDVTLDDIANRAGVTRRTLYHHFDSREDILQAAYASNMVDFIKKLRSNIDSKQPFPDFVTDVIMYIIYRAPEQPLFKLNTHGEMARQALTRYFTSKDAVDEWIITFQPAYIRALQKRTINPELELSAIIEWIGRIGFSFNQHPSAGDQSPEVVRKDIEHFFGNALRYDAG